MKRNVSNNALVLSLIASVVASPSFAQDENKPQEEVLVTGIRGALENALEIKKDAASFVDAISSEDIGKFPDQNIAESLQRLPGVTIDRRGGEGSKITIRGFGPEFNQVRLNNRQLATITGGRDFDFQVIASELINGAEVVKGSTADIAEGSIGASINLKTLRPLDNAGFNAAGSVKSRYQDLSENWSPLVSGLISNTFADDTMGIVVAMSYQDIEQRIDKTFNGTWLSRTWDFDGDGPEAARNIRIPNRAGYRMETDARERLGLTTTFQWQPNDSLEITLDGFYVDFSRTSEDIFNVHVLQVAFSPANVADLTVDENGTLTHVIKNDQPNDIGYNFTGGDITTEALGANVRWLINDNLTMEFDLSLSNAKAEDAGISMFPGMRFQCDPADTLECAGGNSIASNRIEWYLDDIASITTSFDLTDASLARSHFNNSSRDDTEDEITEMQLDFDWELDKGIFTTLHFGASFLDRRFDDIRFDNQGTNGFNPFGRDDPNALWTTTARTRSNGRILDLPDELFEVISVPDLLDEANGPIPRQWLRATSYDALCASLIELSGNSLGCSLAFNANATTYVEETDTALYIRADFEGQIGHMPYTGNFGIRRVGTETTSNGFTRPLIGIDPRDPTGGTTGLDPVYGDQSEVVVTNKYDHILPSLNARLEMKDDLFLRFAASKTLTRPDTGDIGTALTYGGSFEGFNRTGDNPYLQPYESFNIDTSIEYYADNGNNLGFNLFYKDITDFIATVVTPYESGFDHPALGPIIGEDRRKKNRPGGTIQGFELSALVYFDFLPGIWANFGLQANYTYVDSDDKAANDNVEYPDPENVLLPESGLEGFTPDSYNIVGFYEDDNLQARLAWNRRSDFMDVRIGAGGLPEHFESYDAMDFSASYNITDSISVIFEALNMLNENTLRFADRRERVLDNEYTGRRYTFGVRASF